ncbi:RNA 3'-terminal phosphate cyclase [Thiohalobacter sp. IOR34]|uniref:RNA 3'-terminal phosphate cyclase n=1 Tax=Thiohalobacter sp. IOR34 TaxID=3057176 RepID=UPI0025B006DD|nr:RNA 3'-terminal phosphate cyclase [Thiohalobacter sp. IOR34]WJW76409.1 RNA 3'-terminal phosphate cyclase [Thiohalobacter sp. IOR34]
MLSIDGSMGEGGGQVLRSALSLSLCLQRPVRIRNIRSRRRHPGLQPQHLAAVRAAAAVGQARVEGAEQGSRELLFVPQAVQTGDYRFDIGTAGSTGLVLQTILPALLLGNGDSEVQLIGGTHNPLAPSYDFLRLAFLPLLERMGARVTLQLERHGFYPAGGGRVRLRVSPVSALRPLWLLERGRVLDCLARVLLANLPTHIAERELRVIGRRLGIGEDRQTLILASEARGPGNAVMVVVRSERVTEVFSGFGQRGVSAEVVAGRVVKAVRHYLHADVPVGENLADQLLLPLVLAGGGGFTTLPPSRHTLTNLRVLQQFMDLEVACEPLSEVRWRIVLNVPAGPLARTTS